jgi:hypothetical protein
LPPGFHLCATHIDSNGIAGNKDLLVLGAFQGTQIITPAAYVGAS